MKVLKLVGIAVSYVLVFVVPAQSQDRPGTVAPNQTFISPGDSARAYSQLRARLDALFTSKTYRSGQVSAVVHSLDRRVNIYERSADLALAPASTTKLFSTGALYSLHRGNGAIETDVVTDAVIRDDGTVLGDVWLVGRGDALLSVNDLEALADEVRRAGIQRITGNVYADDTFFDDNVDRASYSGDGEVVQATGAIRALVTNKGSVTVVVNGAPNGRTTAQCVPGSDGFEIVIVSPPKGRRRRGRVSITTSRRADGVQVFTVTGWPGANRSVTKVFQMTSPAVATAGVFARRLQAGGVDVDGTVGAQQAPRRSRRIAAFRRSIEDFCSVVNKRSDNFLAEHVFKMVGALCGDHTTTPTTAKRVMLTSLDTLKVSRTGCVFNDGSGLSRRNRVSARTETELLRAIYRMPWATSFKNTLPIAGVDGTLRGRMHGTAAVGNVRAKTGTLRNVSALAGYVTTADGERLAFAFVSNGPNVHGYKGTENLAAIALAEFSLRKSVSTTSPDSEQGTTAGEDEEVLDDVPPEEDVDDEILNTIRTSRPPEHSVLPLPDTPVRHPPVQQPADGTQTTQPSGTATQRTTQTTPTTTQSPATRTKPTVKPRASSRRLQTRASRRTRTRQRVVRPNRRNTVRQRSQTRSRQRATPTRRAPQSRRR